MLKIVNNGSTTSIIKMAHRKNFSSIVILWQNGRDCLNAWGGRTPLHTGSKSYINRCWSKI